MRFRDAGKFGLADLLMMLAVVLFFLATLAHNWRPAPWPWSNGLVAAGLFCWSLSTML
jgi:hypothetical protein